MRVLTIFKKNTQQRENEYIKQMKAANKCGEVTKAMARHLLNQSRTFFSN
jgi:uncharacterized protein YxeA